MDITKFFGSDYVDSASYDSVRKLASYNDGLKNSGRKVLWVLLKRDIRKGVKVSRLASTVSELTEYLHAEDALQDVIMNFPKRYPGTNNMPLLTEEGNFGKRFKNEASAARYVFTALEDYTPKVFLKQDNSTLVEQEFEGTTIEPKYLVPILPNILINGSINAITTGFTQQILPRRTSDILKMVKGYIKTGKAVVPTPGWNNWKGTVTKDPKVQGKWYITGKYEKMNSFGLKITELPVWVDLAEYTQHLANLKESKIITSYEDRSRDENFEFIVKVPKKFFEQSEDEIIDTLNLRTSFVEKYNCIGLENDICEFDTPEEVFYAYAKVREHHYELRIKNQISEITESIKLNVSKYLFVQGIVTDKIVVQKRTKDNIVKQLKNVRGIIEKDGSFDYLLSMNIYSLTTEKMEDLKKLIDKLKEELSYYKNVTPNELWISDLNALTK